MLKRELCPLCHVNLVAVNYKKDGITHYRNACTGCLRKGRHKKPQPPAWAKTGYKKPAQCEICGFRAKLLAKQLFVYHVDGNLKNNNWHNLKTVCANCQIELANNRLTGWRASPIVPDF